MITGLKRPRKRRPAQAKRGEHGPDSTHVIKTPTPDPLSIRRRHSTTFEDTLTGDPYPRYLSPLSSSSLPPSASSFHEGQMGHVLKERGDVLFPPIGDYSLRLPPLHIPDTIHSLPTPPSTSRTAVFGSVDTRVEPDEERKKDDLHGVSQNCSYVRTRGTHTPTASSSSSHSTQSYGSASSISSSGGGRPNPMSISSLLNDGDPTYSATTVVTERLDKMDIDVDERGLKTNDRSFPTEGEWGGERDVVMRPVMAMKEETPFSSDQTLRAPSPTSTSPQSHGRRSATPVGGPTEQQSQREGQQERRRTPAPAFAPTGPRPSSRPPPSSSPSRSRVGPAKPTRPPPPVPSPDKPSSLAAAAGGGGGSSKRSPKSGKLDARGTKSAGTSKHTPWAGTVDLSKMDLESESE